MTLLCKSFFGTLRAMHPASSLLPEDCSLFFTTVPITLYNNYLFAHQFLSTPPPGTSLPAPHPLLKNKAWLLVDLNTCLLNEMLNGSMTRRKERVKKRRGEGYIEKFSVLTQTDLCLFKHLQFKQKEKSKQRACGMLRNRAASCPDPWHLRTGFCVFLFYYVGHYLLCPWEREVPVEVCIQGMMWGASWIPLSCLTSMPGGAGSEPSVFLAVWNYCGPKE